MTSAGDATATTRRGEEREPKGVRGRLLLKIAGIISAVMVLLAVVTVWIVTAQLKDAYLEEFKSKGSAIAVSLAKSSEPLLGAETPDSSQIQAFIDEYKNIKGVRYIAINNPNGELIAASLAPYPDSLRKRLSAMEGPKDTGGEESLSAPTYVNFDERELPAVGNVLNITAPILTGVLGLVHVGMDMTVIQSAMTILIVKVLLAFGVCLVLGLALAVLLARVIVNPLNSIITVMQRVSAGNLEVLSQVKTRDELALVGYNANRMIVSLREIVAQVERSTRNITNAITEILSSAQDQEQGVVEQAGSIEETANSMNALTDTARTISSHSDAMMKTAEDMALHVKTGEDALLKARQVVDKIVHHNELVADQINQLYERSQAILSVVDIIDDISDRLDLLALNAALEGSRAGEVGKGFSLVAQEMRRLAENVTGSTKEIKQTVQEIHRYTQSSLDSSQDSLKTAGEGAEVMSSVITVMSEIFKLIAQMNNLSRQITVITQQQVSSSQQVVTAMHEIETITHQEKASAQHLTTVATQLASFAEVLLGSISAFDFDTQPQADSKSDKAAA